VDATSKILVVDDNKINLLITEKLLNEYNYKVVTVLSGKEAIIKIQSDSFDLVILDIVMPEMDGYETCQKIKKIDPNILVVMLTGLLDNDAFHRSFEVGAVDFIKKPINKIELFVRVRNVLRIRNTEKSLHRQHQNDKEDRRIYGKFDKKIKTIKS
jgi:PleD family two-component response regulator